MSEDGTDVDLVLEVMNLETGESASVSGPGCEVFKEFLRIMFGDPRFDEQVTIGGDFFHYHGGESAESAESSEVAPSQSLTSNVEMLVENVLNGIPLMYHLAANTHTNRSDAS